MKKNKTRILVWFIRVGSALSNVSAAIRLQLVIVLVIGRRFKRR